MYCIVLKIIICLQNENGKNKSPNEKRGAGTLHTVDYFG